MPPRSNGTCSDRFQHGGSFLRVFLFRDLLHQVEVIPTHDRVFDESLAGCADFLIIPLGLEDFSALPNGNIP